MTGPALAIQLFLLFGYLGSILFPLIYVIRHPKDLKRSIPAGILVLALTTLGIYICWSRKSSEHIAAKKFLGDYKLKTLDRQECENCKVRLNDGYTYDILVNNKVVGNGKWHIETAIDIPGPFLKVDFGPNYVLREEDRLIDYIDRTQNK